MSHIYIRIYIYIYKRGTQSRTRFFVVGKVARALGHDICDALIGLHAFTGCDTVSACAGREKKMRIFKHVKTNKTYEEAFCWLGQTWDVSAELIQKLQEISSRMYIPSTDATSVNDLRYQLLVCSTRRMTMQRKG